MGKYPIWVCPFLLLLLTCLERSIALTEGEETTILEFYQTWPALVHLSPPWSPNASLACDNPPFQGLECSEGPEKHIIGLTTEQWNAYGTIPDSIGNLVWLKNLSIIDTPIPAIPATIGNLVNLEVLSTLNAGLSDLPNSLNQLTQLTYFKLSEPSTYAAPLGRFPELKSKRLSTFYLKGYAGPGAIPTWFCDIDSLEFLTLDSLDLSGFEACQGKLGNLQSILFSQLPKMGSLTTDSLMLGRSNLSSIRVLTPTTVRGHLQPLRNLKVIEMSGAGLIGTLDPLWEAPELNFVDIYGPSLSGTLSSRIGNLSKLSHFFLAPSGVSGSIPPEIGLCTNLERMKVAEARLTGYLPSEMGNLAKLKDLYLHNNDFSGSIPHSFVNLRQLRTLMLTSTSLSGPIPSELMSLPNLIDFDASGNFLSGSIPDIPTNSKLIGLKLSMNALTGTLPPNILGKVSLIDLRSNQLTGSIPSSISKNRLMLLDLSFNQLIGFLPRPASSQYASLHLSNNQLSGEIPPTYSSLSLRTVNIANNQLYGNLEILFSNKELRTLDISSNLFEGSLPTSLASSSLAYFYFSDNRFVGSVPDFPQSMIHFIGSNNQLSGELGHIFGGKYPSLEMLDLSRNRLGSSTTLPDKLWHTNLTLLSLGSNLFRGPIPPPHYAQVLLRNLDLSSNELTGALPDLGLFPLTSINLRDNLLGGLFDILKYPHLTSLDISSNRFKFDVSLLTSHQSLTALYAQNNQLYGSASLFGMNSLQLADLSNNQIDRVDFKTVGHLFDQFSLVSLSINDNPAKSNLSLASIMNSTTLRNSNYQISSTVFPGVVCWKMTFSKLINREFVYNESLFGYQQCRCDQYHFGSPPTNCFSCRGLETSSQCGFNKLVVSRNNFIFRSTVNPTTLLTESCISNSLATLKDSNCIGIDITYSDSDVTVSNGDVTASDENVKEPTENQLAHQCRTGSSGRLCSKCDCEAFQTGKGSCFYLGAGNLCRKCSKVYGPSIYIPIVCLFLIVVILVISTVLYYVLASKRSLKEVKWEDLPLMKRLLYRLIHLSSLGQITIVVTFVQILAKVTNWNVAILGWLKLINGEGEGLGLRCFLPFLSNTTLELISKLMLPFIGVAIVWASVGLAECLHRLVPLLKRPHYSHIEGDSDSEYSSLIRLEGIKPKEKTSIVTYPASALATSISVSVIRFFYFGTALTAHEYLFREYQKGTNVEFVQSVPWMLYSEASRLRSISIPFILLYLLGFPLAFVVACWKLRHKISSPFVRMYFGSLFENFGSHTFWWELVNIMKKLLVSLLLRGLNPSSAFHPISVSFILVVIGVVVTIVNPWKLKHENAFDGVGSVLLIFSLASSWLSSLSNSKAVLICIASLDAIFILSSALVIVWKTFRDETLYEKEWKARFGPDAPRPLPLHSYSDDSISEIEDESGSQTGLM